MGTELAPNREWNHDASLDWHLMQDPRRQGIDAYLEALGALYNTNSCFWRRDHEPSGFGWIAVDDREQSVLSYARFDGAQHAVVALNLTPVPRNEYRMGAPRAGSYRYALNSDDESFGGSGFSVPAQVTTEDVPYHGFAQSMVLALPPLSMVVLFTDTAIGEETEHENVGDVDVMEVLKELLPDSLGDVVAHASAAPKSAAPKAKKSTKGAKTAKDAKSPKAPKPAKSVESSGKRASKDAEKTASKSERKTGIKNDRKATAKDSTKALKKAAKTDATPAPRCADGFRRASQGGKGGCAQEGSGRCATDAEGATPHSEGG